MHGFSLEGCFVNISAGGHCIWIRESLTFRSLGELLFFKPVFSFSKRDCVSTKALKGAHRKAPGGNRTHDLLALKQQCQPLDLNK